MNKKIFLSGVSILSALVLMGAATFAFFNDVASSNNNTFSSGTFALSIRDDNEGFTDTIVDSFDTPTNWAPGDKSTDFICFRNDGSIPIEQVLFRLTSADAGSTTLDDFIYVSNIELGDVTSNPTACEAVGTVGTEGLTNFKALFDSRFGVDAPLSSLIPLIEGDDNVQDDLLDGPAAISPNSIFKLRVEWTFNSSATEAVAGEAVNVNLGFTGTQNELP